MWFAAIIHWVGYSISPSFDSVVSSNKLQYCAIKASIIAHAHSLCAHHKVIVRGSCVSSVGSRVTEKGKEEWGQLNGVGVRRGEDTWDDQTGLIGDVAAALLLILLYRTTG